MASWPDNGRGVEGNNQLGFANFKENIFTSFTPVSSPVFGPNSSSTVSKTTALPNPPANTTGNAVGFATKPLFGDQVFSSQFSTCDFQQPSNSVPPSSGLSPFSSSNSSTGGSQVVGYSSGWTPFSSGNSSNSSTAVPFGVQHYSSGSLATTSSFGRKLPFGGPAFAPTGSTFRGSTTLSTGDQLFLTNPSPTGASQNSTCVFQQPSNSVPSRSLFTRPRPYDLFSSTKCSQSGGQLSSGRSPFSSVISSSPAVLQSGVQSGCSPFSCGISSSNAGSQLGGQQSSGWSLFSSGISNSPAVSQPGGQHSSGWSPFSCGISSSPAVSQPGGQQSSGWSPFSSGISSSPPVSQPGGQHSSGWSPFSSGIPSSPIVFPFGVPLSSTTPPFGVQPFSLGSSATTSPLGTKLPFGGSIFPTVDSGLGGSTTSSTGPFTRSLVQENTSANNVSVLAPFTRSNVGVSDIQGTRMCSYAPIPEVDNICNGKLTSISAMPFYNEKSHEELRLEDNQLTGRTGSSTNSKSSNQHNASADNVSVFAPFTNSDPGRSGFQGTKWSYETSPVEGGYATGTESSSCFPVINISISVSPSLVATSSSSSIGAIPGFCFSNPSASDSLRLGPSVLSTCTSHRPTSSLPLHHPVISIPLSIEIRHLGDLLATAQITIPVPTSGTVPASNNATVTESTITSLPEPVSTGGFTPRFPCSTDNRPTPVGHIFLANPVATEARVTLPTTTVQYGISGLPVSENTELAKGIPPMMNDRPLSLDRHRSPPIEKYKPDDEDVMAMIPKLKCPEYYTEPSMDDLVANELKTPGFCRQVKDFVIGKRGYGSIRFLGETDVRNLDLESMVQFNIREVIFCMDKKAKPPVGQGLNKAAEITLLNVNCIDKNTGKQYIDGPKVDMYKQLLVRKTVEQGAEFVSFDPAKGEWIFKVQHF